MVPAAPCWDIIPHWELHPSLGQLPAVNRHGAPQGGGSEPLPPHKFSPHDIVRVRPSKGDGSGAPLAEGVVYRVRDSAITVAGGGGGGWGGVGEEFGLTVGSRCG